MGYPMSQRECAGFNWPPLPVKARDPLDIGPKSASCAAMEGWVIAALAPLFMLAFIAW